MTTTLARHGLAGRGASSYDASLQHALPDQSPHADSRRPEHDVDPLRVGSWLAAAVVLAAGLLALDGLPVGVMRDDGMYVVLAKAIAAGDGFRWIHLPGAPEATHFPPGYPLVLAALWKLWPQFPANVLLFKAANAFFMSVSAALLVRLAVERLQLDLRVAVALGVVACVGLPTLVLSTVVMSEPLFLMLALLALLRVERLAVRAHDGARTGAGLDAAAAAGLLIGCAMLVRTHGLALLGAAVLVLAMRRRWRDGLVLGAVAAVIVLPWLLWVAAYDALLPPAMRGNYASYGGWLLDGLRADGPMLLVRTAGRSAAELSGMFAALFAPGMPPVLRAAALCLLAALTVVGARELWRRAPVTALSTAAYLVIVVLWPFSPTRFVWAVWPLVLLVLVAGVARLWWWRPTPLVLRVPRAALLAGALLLVAGYAQYGVRAVRGQWWSSIPRTASRGLEPMLQWVATRTGPEQVVATHLEGIVYLYGGRVTLPVAAFTTSDYFRRPTAHEGAAALREIMDFHAPDALVITPRTPRPVVEAVDLLTRGPSPALALRDSFPDGYVFTPRRSTAARIRTTDR